MRAGRGFGAAGGSPGGPGSALCLPAEPGASVRGGLLPTRTILKCQLPRVSSQSVLCCI